MSKSGSNKTDKNRQRRTLQIASSPLSAHETTAKNSTMCLELFVATKFIPEHVETKSAAGRRHYHAILKHVLHPEKIDCLFSSETDKARARMKSLPDWPYLDDVRLCDLQPAHVRQLTASAFAHGYSTQTILHIRNVISAIISHAKREKCFDGENPILASLCPDGGGARFQT